ncbi:MAG TPA: hypothetical protein VIF64_12075 [Pyrinomonadaceae bacterium]|jgi:hypothetical protein
MKKILFQSLCLLVLALCISVTGYAQGDTNTKVTDPNAKATTAGVKDATPAVAITATTTPIELARIALAAQGGEKFRNLKSMVLRGSVDLYGPNSTQSIPGSFVIAYAGDKMRLEVDARPLFSFKQIYDGQQSYSSLPGTELPPESKFGLGILRKFDQPGYEVTALPDKKKQRGFRIAGEEGNATDFYVDTATGRVVSFTYSFNGANFGMEHKKFKEIEGVLVPSSFTRRIEMPQGAAFAEFNVKDIKLNQTLGDDVFAMPN